MKMFFIDFFKSLKYISYKMFQLILWLVVICGVSAALQFFAKNGHEKVVTLLSLISGFFILVATHYLYKKNEEKKAEGSAMLHLFVGVFSSLFVFSGYLAMHSDKF